MTPEQRAADLIKEDDMEQAATPPLLGAMSTSEAIDKIAEALAAAQGEFENPDRNRDVTVNGRTRDGKAYSYTFKYATLDNILDGVRPVLSKHQLSIVQVPTATNGTLSVITRLLHSSGQWIEGVYNVTPEKDGLQGQGAAISYVKRYSIAAMLGIASDEDDDANVADGNQVAKKDGEDMWGGPLTKTQIKAAVREFASELEGVSDLAELIAFLNTPENIAMTDQLMRDLPQWYYGREGSDVPGLHARIEAKRDEMTRKDSEKAA